MATGPFNLCLRALVRLCLLRLRALSLMPRGPVFYTYGPSPDSLVFVCYIDCLASCFAVLQYSSSFGRLQIRILLRHDKHVSSGFPLRSSAPAAFNDVHDHDRRTASGRLHRGARAASTAAAAPARRQMIKQMGFQFFSSKRTEGVIKTKNHDFLLLVTIVATLY